MLTAANSVVVWVFFHICHMRAALVNPNCITSCTNAVCTTGLWTCQSCNLYVGLEFGWFFSLIDRKLTYMHIALYAEIYGRARYETLQAPDAHLLTETFELTHLINVRLSLQLC